ncbi:MAG: uridine kinase [Christensenellales bacterium]|jgi:uridine kinase
MIIGICGASGSGKTTLAEELARRLNNRCVYLKQDAYYRDHSHLPLEERRRVNYDEPNVFEHDALYDDLRALRDGRAINRKGYDYVNHRRADPGDAIAPAEVVIIEGIHAFYDARARDLMQMRIFIQVDPDICLLRRFRRDISERGRDVESVANQYIETVKPMYEKHVRTYAAYADIILAHGGRNPRFVDMLMLYIDSKRDT